MAHRMFDVIGFSQVTAYFQQRGTESLLPAPRPIIVPQPSLPHSRDINMIPRAYRCRPSRASYTTSAPAVTGQNSDHSLE